MSLRQKVLVNFYDHRKCNWCHEEVSSYVLLYRKYEHLDHRLHLHSVCTDFCRLVVTNGMDNIETETDDMIENNPLLADHGAQLLSKVHFPSCRLVLLFMGFLGFINVYCLRVNLSVALVAMLNHTQQPYVNVSRTFSDSNTGDVCESDESTVEADKVHMRSGEFNWDSNTQGTVLGAFFYGYITTQV